MCFDFLWLSLHFLRKHSFSRWICIQGEEMCTSGTHNRLTWSSLQFYYYRKTSAEMISGSVFCDFGVIVSTFAGCDVRSSLLMWEDLANFLHVTPERDFRIEHNRYLVLVRFAWCGLRCHLQIPLRTYNLQKLEDVLTTSKFRICWRRLSVWGEADSETSPKGSIWRSR